MSAKDFHIEQNYPNPFNPTTTIRFGLPEPSDVRLDVYNMTGQHVVTLVSRRLNAGLHSITWDGKDETGKTVASGVYLYRLVTEKFIDAKRMVLVK
jgi:flagellar hook assembly protein FlgD